MRTPSPSKTISVLIACFFSASLLLPTLAAAETLSRGKAYPNLPPNTIQFLHAGSLEIDEYVIPSWVDYDEEQDIVTGDESWDIFDVMDQAVLVDSDTIEIGEAQLSRLGHSDIWRVEAWICTVHYDVVSCGWETLGLLSTEGFDLADALTQTKMDLDPSILTVARRDHRMVAICAAISVVAVAAATMCVQGDVNLTFNVLGYDATLTC